VLRITDAASGQFLPLRLPRGTLLHIHAHPPIDPDPGDLTAARVLLLADVLARVAELRGLQAVVTQNTAEPDPKQPADLALIRELLGIRPPEAGDGHTEAPRGADATADVHVLGPDSASLPGIGVRVGAASLSAAVPALATMAALTTEQNLDPLAVRLALLNRPYADPVNLTASACREADATLAHWRGRVAGWAEHPSRPIPADSRTQAEAHLDADLATAEVLGMLRRLEAEPAVPDGAKFETFIYLDRILGLHLARDVGR
jgi:hypothetical protein